MERDALLDSVLLLQDIFLAAKTGNVELASRLIAENGSCVNHKETDGTTPLHWAAMK